MQENGWVHSQKQISSSEDTVDTVELEAYCESDNEHWLDYSIRPPQVRFLYAFGLFCFRSKVGSAKIPLNFVCMLNPKEYHLCNVTLIC